jgi:hypothetical protein
VGQGGLDRVMPPIDPAGVLVYDAEQPRYV